MSRYPFRARMFFGYPIFACLISWLLWWPLVITGGAPAGSWLRYLHLFGSLGPAASGLAMAWLCDGRSGVVRLVQDIKRWRVGWLWWGAALIAPFLILMVAQIAALAMGAEIEMGVIGRSAEYPGMPLGVYVLAVLIFYGFGEEIGWRGFALPTLQRRFHPVAATLIVTGIWAVWHVPLFFFSPGMMALGAGGVVGWLFSLLTGSFLLTLLFNKTGGSVLIAACFHAAMDLAFLGPPEVMIGVGAMTTFVGLYAVWAVAREPLRAV